MADVFYCPVQVSRQAVDGRSLSICYHEPSSELGPLKPRVDGLFLVQGGDRGAMAALCGNPSRFFANNVVSSSRKTKLKGAPDARWTLL